MTIQRQYSLPNCRLVLEGWGDDNGLSSNFMEGRPVMTILTNAECHFSGQDKPLSGDREFLEHLIVSVNQYAQQVLSGVPHQLASRNGDVSVIHLNQTDQAHHRLTMRPSQSNGRDGSGSPSDALQLDLSTVQLFDLVEAIDQMVADAQTLPDLYLDLTPVPKRGVASQEPVTRRMMPAVLGVSSLAIAAVALFFIPVPEFEITEPEIQATEDTEDTLTEPPLAGTEPEPFPGADAAESDANESDDVADSTVSESAEPSTLDNTESETLSQEDIEELFTTATPIADSDQLDALTTELRTQIVASWTEAPEFEDELEYRVGVSEEGQIIGYKYENDAAITYDDEVPLGDLTVFPQVDEEPINSETPIAQFRVVFLPSGVIEVSPWYGRLLEDEES